MSKDLIFLMEKPLPDLRKGVLESIHAQNCGLFAIELDTVPSENGSR